MSSRTAQRRKWRRKIGEGAYARREKRKKGQGPKLRHVSASEITAMVNQMRPPPRPPESMLSWIFRKLFG